MRIQLSLFCSFYPFLAMLDFPPCCKTSLVTLDEYRGAFEMWKIRFSIQGCLWKYVALMQERCWGCVECEDMVLPLWPLNPHRAFSAVSMSSLQHECNKKHESRFYMGCDTLKRSSSEHLKGRLGPSVSNSFGPHPLRRMWGEKRGVRILQLPDWSPPDNPF